LADAAEGGEFFFARSGSVAGIPDAPVDSLSPKIDGAQFGG